MNYEEKIRQAIIDHEGLKEFSLNAAEETESLSEKAVHFIQASYEQRIVIALKSLLEGV